MKSTDFLPYSQVQTSQFPLHISYFLQNCKKGKSGEMDLPSLKNDITGSEPAFGIANILQSTRYQKLDNKKARPLLTLPYGMITKM
jgi:hypothetical protein